MLLFILSKNPCFYGVLGKISTTMRYDDKIVLKRPKFPDN